MILVAFLHCSRQFYGRIFFDLALRFFTINSAEIVTEFTSAWIQRYFFKKISVIYTKDYFFSALDTFDLISSDILIAIFVTTIEMAWFQAHLVTHTNFHSL